MDGRSIEDRIVVREPFGPHDGASGATLERALLDDGSRLVLKTYRPQDDLTMLLADRDVPLEVELWRRGVLRRIPAPMGHAVSGAWPDDGSWVVAMEDLDGLLLSYDSLLDMSELRRILHAAHTMHEAFRGSPVPGLWPLERRLAVFAPRTMARFAASENPLPRWVLEGWQRFDDVVPPDVAAVVGAVLDDPRILADPLRRRGGQTLLHGDYWTPNIALTARGVVAIDWALATWGPPVVEFTSFMVGCAGQVSASKDAIVEELRAVQGDRHDEPLLRLALLGGLVELGWNLAWHVVEHPDESNRDDLQWWVDAARRGVETGLLSQ